MAQGLLRVYLGAAPGVGKTVAMLAEGNRRAARGTDVVVALVEDHGRAYTAGQVGNLPVIPRRVVRYRGIDLTDMDLPAVLARRPRVALVDELAHSNPPGTEHPKRWQDVKELLAAGIDVITTVNIQHLESVSDVVASITGITQAETVPDDTVRGADQIELVDMSPQALRRRMAHGHVYPAGSVDAALGNYFREGNLTALRELALLWVADRVDEGLDRYRKEHGIRDTWAARERIVVALTGGPEGMMLLRRGARIAGRVTGRDLVAVHVVRSDGSVGADAAEIASLRLLTEQLGGTFQLVIGDDIPSGLLDFTRAVNGTQIIVGASRHGHIAQLFRPSTSMAVVRDSGDIDVHVVTHERAAHRRWQVRPSPDRRRRWAWATSVLVPGALSGLLLPWRGEMNLSTVLLVFLLGVLAVALVGGIGPAVVTAVAAGLLANLLFTPPTGSLTIAEPQNVFALLTFVAVGVTVAAIVDRSRLRADQAARGRAEAEMLAVVAVRSLTDADPVTAVLEEARVGFGMSSVLLVARVASSGDTSATGMATVVGSAGAQVEPARIPDGADALVTSGESNVLALYGHPLAASERRLLEVVAAQAALALERSRLTGEAEQAEKLRQTETVRTALLSAVSHDLRTPLASITAAASTLLDRSVAYSDADRAELLETIAVSADRLDGLLANLLDLSRLNTGVLTPLRRPVSVDEIMHRALVGVPTDRIVNDIPDDLPLVDTDAGLLERVMANVLGNAVRYSPNGTKVRLQTVTVHDTVEIQVVDHGPGVPETDRATMFAPFQRLGDAPAGSGLGLGLAVARGLAEAAGARIDAEDTPGGGLTMIVTVPMATAQGQRR